MRHQGRRLRTQGPCKYGCLFLLCSLKTPEHLFLKAHLLKAHLSKARLLKAHREGVFPPFSPRYLQKQARLLNPFSPPPPFWKYLSTREEPVLHLQDCLPEEGPSQKKTSG